MNVFVEDTKKHIIKDKEVYEGSLVCHPESHRVIKMCISLSQSSHEEAQGFLSKVISKLQDLFLKNLDKVLLTRSSYVLIAIMEASNNADHIISLIKNSGVKLDTVVGANIYMNSK